MTKELEQQLDKNHGRNQHGCICTNYSNIPGLKVRASTSNGDSGIGVYKGRQVWWNRHENSFRVKAA